MIVVVLTWQEPQEGAHAILFQKIMGDEGGVTIARMTLVQKGRSEDNGENDRWEELALNLRYSSGEELYDVDNHIFKRRGIERS